MGKKKEKEIFLYGKLRYKNAAVAYCELHKCFLEPIDVKEKKCNYKKCKYRRDIYD